MQFPGSCKSAAAAVALAAIAMPAFADLPVPVQQGNVTYVSGGIGLTEQDSLKAEAHNYNLAITNANKAGQYENDTALDIQAKNGKEVLRVDRTGPLFYAKLPPGEYVIHAMNNGRQDTRTVRISVTNRTDVYLTW